MIHGESTPHKCARPGSARHDCDCLRSVSGVADQKQEEGCAAECDRLHQFARGGDGDAACDHSVSCPSREVQANEHSDVGNKRVIANVRELYA